MIAFVIALAFAVALFALFGSLPWKDILGGAGEWTAPMQHLLNNLILGGFIGIAVLVSWIFFRQGFGWFSSVIGRFRWKWFALTALVFGAGELLLQVGELFLLDIPEGVVEALVPRPYTVFMLASILLTVPLQASGEEFLMRGLFGRLIATAVPLRKTGLALSAVASSLLFMLFHQSTDLYSNIMFFSWGIMMWWLAYRTGGIEASAASHVVHNILEQWPVPFLDLAEVTNRGEMSLRQLAVFLAVQLVLTVVIDLLARRRGLIRLAAPGAEGADDNED